MKHTVKIIALLTLALALLLAQAGCAESDAGTPAPTEAPSAETLSERYFAAIANLESGTAGASLKTAIAAAEVCAVAEAFAVVDPDAESLCADLRAAFAEMDEAGQAAFRENFDAVRALIDDALEDYEANRGVFEDAGVAEAMDGFVRDPLNRLAWENLRDHTLTLGNDAESADADS